MNLFSEMTVMQVRVARPTDRLDALERFYHRLIGLPKLTSWRHGIDGDHHGYDGLILGMPDGGYHLEFTHHVDGSPCQAPGPDNLLVFYLPPDDVARMAARMQGSGIPEVRPENPWWAAGGHTYADPDGWRVVFMTGPGVSRPPVTDDEMDETPTQAQTMDGTTA